MANSGIGCRPTTHSAGTMTTSQTTPSGPFGTSAATGWSRVAMVGSRSSEVMAPDAMNSAISGWLRRQPSQMWRSSTAVVPRRLCR